MEMKNNIVSGKYVRPKAYLPESRENKLNEQNEEKIREVFEREKEEIKNLRKLIEKAETLTLPELKKIDLANNHLVAYERLKILNLIQAMEQKQEEQRKEIEERENRKRHIIRKTIQLLGAEEAEALAKINDRILNLRNMLKYLTIMDSDYRRICDILETSAGCGGENKDESKYKDPYEQIDYLAMLTVDLEKDASYGSGLGQQIYLLDSQNEEELEKRLTRIDSNIHSLNRRLHYFLNEYEEQRDIIIEVFQKKEGRITK